MDLFRMKNELIASAGKRLHRLIWNGKTGEAVKKDRRMQLFLNERRNSALHRPGNEIGRREEESGCTEKEDPPAAGLLSAVSALIEKSGHPALNAGSGTLPLQPAQPRHPRGT